MVIYTLLDSFSCKRQPISEIKFQCYQFRCTILFHCLFLLEATLLTYVGRYVNRWLNKIIINYPTYCLLEKSQYVLFCLIYEFKVWCPRLSIVTATCHQSTYYFFVRRNRRTHPFSEPLKMDICSFFSLQTVL